MYPNQIRARETSYLGPMQKPYYLFSIMTASLATASHSCLCVQQNYDGLSAHQRKPIICNSQCLRSVSGTADLKLALPQGAIRIHAMDEAAQNLYGAMDSTSPPSWNTYSPAWISSYVTAQQATLHMAVSHNAVEACLPLLVALASWSVASPLCTSHVATAA